MLNRSWLVALALVIGSSLVWAGPAFAKKNKSSDESADEGSEDFDPENIDECKIESVNALSSKTEKLAGDWSSLKGKVDGIPTKIGEAAGKEVATVDAAIEEILALELPLTVDVSSMKVSVDKEGLEGKKAAVAEAIEEVANEVKSVPGDATAVSDAAVALGTEISELIPNLASEFKGNPIQAAAEIPKATKILKNQVDYLTGLPDEIKSTVEMVPAFFEGLAEAAKATKSEVEEAATE